MHSYTIHSFFQTIIPGPPFAFGSILVILALLVAIFIPEKPPMRDRDRQLTPGSPKSPTHRVQLVYPKEVGELNLLLPFKFYHLYYSMLNWSLLMT